MKNLAPHLRSWVISLLILFSLLPPRSSAAQFSFDLLIPKKFVEAIQEYLPRLIEIGASLSDTIAQLNTLSHDAIPSIQKSLAALTQLADFAVGLRNNSSQIACAVAGVLAAGIIFGKLSNDYIFTDDRDKNIFYRLFKRRNAFPLQCAWGTEAL